MLVDRLTWLATAAPNGQVRAIASLKLQNLGAAACAVTAAPRPTPTSAQHALLAADIKRFLERPAETAKMLPAAPAPPGAPIGDIGQDWLSRPPVCSWDEANPGQWLFYQPPF